MNREILVASRRIFLILEYGMELMARSKAYILRNLIKVTMRELGKPPVLSRNPKAQVCLSVGPGHQIMNTHRCRKQTDHLKKSEEVAYRDA